MDLQLMTLFYRLAIVGRDEMIQANNLPFLEKDVGHCPDRLAHYLVEGFISEQMATAKYLQIGGIIKSRKEVIETILSITKRS